jgi:hypothetical protein
MQLSDYVQIVMLKTSIIAIQATQMLIFFAKFTISQNEKEIREYYD